jgi:hypothetical protein
VYYIFCKKASTAHNRSVYASGAVAPSGYEKPQSAYGLSAVFLRHIFAVAGMLRIPLSQPQKRHIQPERYAPLNLKFFCKFFKKMLTFLIFFFIFYINFLTGGMK